MHRSGPQLRIKKLLLSLLIATLLLGSPPGLLPTVGSFHGAASSVAATKKKKKKPACAFAKTAAVWTLQRDCTTKKTVTVPNGVTLDGANFTIHLAGPTSGFSKPAGFTVRAGVVAGGGTAGVRNLMVDGAGLTAGCGAQKLTALLFQFANGPLAHVTVSNNKADGCGSGILVEAFPNAATDVNDVTVTDVAETGVRVEAPPQGTATVNITSATVKDAVLGISYFGTVQGTISSSTVHSPAGGTGVGSALQAVVTLSGSQLDGNASEIGAVADFASLLVQNSNVSGYRIGVGTQNGGAAYATNNTIVGPDGGPKQSAGIAYSDTDSEGSASGNTISDFHDDDAHATSCGIFVAADAGTVTIGTNTFPNPPGNEQDVCDNRP